MRTTLEIDDAVLAAAKDIAAAEGSTAGAVISDLARKGLAANHDQESRHKSGFPIFSVPLDALPLTAASVRALIADEGLPT